MGWTWKDAAVAWWASAHQYQGIDQEVMSMIIFIIPASKYVIF
jgi:hypothetical protein